MKAVITTTIPVRYAQQFILQTLESVAAQTRRTERVVVLDNCSTDATPELVKTFKGLPIEYIRNPRDLGPFGNFNRSSAPHSWRARRRLGTRLFAPRCLRRIAASFPTNFPRTCRSWETWSFGRSLAPIARRLWR